MDTKNCTRCDTVKPRGDFSKHKNSKDGLRPWCRPCCASYRKENAAAISQKEKEYREKNADKYKQWQQEYYAKNGDTIREYSKLYREAMSDEQREMWQKRNIEYGRKYYKENKEEMDAASKKYAAEHKDQLRVAGRKWRAENKDKVNEKARARVRVRRETDPQFKLTTNIRTLIRSAIKKESKWGKSLDLIGCTIPELKAHLESQFDANMNWGNHGSYWHIDHIVPVCFFDMADHAQQKICNNWTNLQPMEAAANESKSGSLMVVVPINPEIFM